VKEDQRPARADVGLQVQSDIVQLTQSAEPLLHERVPANAGSFRRVTVKVREIARSAFHAIPFPAPSRRRTWPTGCPTRCSERWQKSRPVSAAAAAARALKAQKRGRDGSLTALPACYGVALEAGEFVVSHSACGGGYGPPFERDPGYDLREGWITAVRARSVYGVVTTGDAADDTLAVDAAATQSLRSQMRAAASGPDLTSEA
jgi:hypothetical protein